MHLLTVLGLLIALWFSTSSITPAEAEEISATLHCQLSSPGSAPILVSFGMPFPKGFISDVNLIRVKDAAGNEMPAYVRQLVPWRDLAAGTDLPSIRSALIQVNISFGADKTAVLKVETGSARTQNVAEEQPVRGNWVPVDDAKYPGKFGVFEPPVYVTLPPVWLGRCAVKTSVLPYFSHADFNWYDDPLTNSDPKKNFGQNFFRTAINDDPLVIPAEQIWYLEKNPYQLPGEDDQSPFEPWLFDRAMTMFTIYLRSGNVAVLREAHRAAFFYASQLNLDGWWTLKPPEEGLYDLKYSYNESLFTDLLLLGDEGHLPKIDAVTKAAATFIYAYNTNRRLEELWTERHFSYCWLPFIVAFEATGNANYAQEARLRADALFYHQNHPPAGYDHGQAPNDGALMHAYDQHEGIGTWVDDHNLTGVAWWIFSPWQTVLLVDAMQRYYLHSGDQRVLASARRFGDAIINVADAVRDNIPGFEGYAVVGTPVPWYLASSEGNYVYNDKDDYEHCQDVAKITAFAYYCSLLAGSPQAKYRNETLRLIASSKQAMDYSIRPQAHDYGKSIYRLSPPRKFNWWFRTTSDLDYLLNRRQPSMIPIFSLLLP